MKTIFRSFLIFFLITLSSHLAYSTIIGATSLVEDFTTIDYVDDANSTGVWDATSHFARAAAYANGAVTATRPISFGDGSDGVVDTSAGYVFNTDTHPNGYNFKSLRITGGTITVTGSNPLIIRSLSIITITPTLSVNGLNGSAGNSTGVAVPATAKTATCSSRGGAGGSATLAAGLNGGDGVKSDGSTEATHGVGQTGVNAPGLDALSAATGPGAPGLNANYDVAADFICGTGGGGGGGFTNGTTVVAAGGAGGGGGGIIKMVSVGDMTLGAVEAKGGDGGNGFYNGTVGSGNGSGGWGGAIFLQTLNSLFTSVDPNNSGGNSGTSSPYTGSGPAFNAGPRGDTNTSGSTPAWVGTSSSGSYKTDLVPANLQSVVQSAAYDLGTLNASFSTPTIASSGTVSVTYAASKDGTTFTPFTSDITTLSDKNYRFVKFKATFTNPGVAGTSPRLTRLTIPFTKNGLSSVDVKLSAGCGTLAFVGKRNHHIDFNDPSDQVGLITTAFWLLIWFMGLQTLRRT